MKGHRKISDQRIILGLMREALFHSRRIAVSCDDKSIQAILVNVVEESTRSSSLIRELELSPLTTDKVRQDMLYEFRAGFPQFIAKWRTRVKVLESGVWKTMIPTEVEIENRRISKRMEESDKSVFPVVLQRLGLYAEGTILIEDHSRNGIRALLEVDENFPIQNDAAITGRIGASALGSRLTGLVRRIELLEHQPSLGTNKYRVGIQFEERIVDTSREATSASQDRRSFKRAEVGFDVNLFSLLNRDHQIPFKIESASMAGFSGRVASKSDLLLFAVSIAVRIEDTSILAEIVSIEESHLRFQIIAGNSEDRLNWLKRLTPFFNAGTTTTVAEGEEIVDLFCEAGATSSALFKLNRNISDLFVQNLSHENDGHTWIHRWIERNANGSVRGHISAVRASENVWYLGDLASMVSEGRKISREFVCNFFSSFKDYCLTCLPCPEVLLAWFDGHPYWQKFEKYLSGKDGSEVMMRRFIYKRFQSEMKKLNLDWSAREISGSEISKIRKCKNALGDWDRFSEALDFSVQAFGSPTLRRVIDNKMNTEGAKFDRKYFTIQRENIQLLAIFSKFPDGTSPNRNLDVVWCFPLSDVKISEEMKLFEFIRRLGSEYGFRSSGVLFPTGSLDGSAIFTREMIWGIVSPKTFEFFIKD